MGPLFGTKRVLLYNVDPWSRLGFGVPNFGSTSTTNPGEIDTIGTLSLPLFNLADEIAKLQLFIMTHVDAMRTQPPSINTVTRICKMLNRVVSVLAARKMDTNQQLAEPLHYSPAPMPWNIHPVPYFEGYVRNHWLAEYNELIMVALTNFYQHSDNNIPLEVTVKFAQDIYQFFRLIKLRIGTELLGIDRTKLQDDAFLFSQTDFDAYKPAEVTLNIEALDGPGDIWALPTDVDIRPLLKGIPANLILPNLCQYPIGPIPGATGLSGEDTLAQTAQPVAVGTGGVGGQGETAAGPGVTDSSAAGSASAGPAIGRPTF